jgi:transcriptional regulator with XRE-family HTH domain
MTKKASKLIATAERSPLYWAEAAWLQFTEDLSGLMQSQNVSRAELARRLGVSPAYITKVFRGTVNLTLESMCRLTLALAASPRLHVAAIDKLTRWADVPAVNEVQTEFVFSRQLSDAAPYRVASVTSDSLSQDAA